MQPKNKKELITDLIIKGKTGAAIEELITLLEGTDYFNDAVLLSARYNDLSRKVRIDVIDSTTAAVEQNKIINAILALLNEVKLEDRQVPIRNTPPINDDRKKLALVVGCNDYEFAGKLKNPINDATGIKKELENLGFTVSIRENPNLRELKMAVDDFGVELKNFDIGLFYFAGHGVQVQGLNYLIPVEANLMAERFVEYDCLRADRVLSYMEQSNSEVNIVILDACRNNPFERSWGRGLTGKGLAFMDAPKGSLIGYATSPGKTASDGDGGNGLYTGELIKTIGEKGLSINQMFQKVRKSVMDISQNNQIPWEATSLTADFYFNR